VTTNDLLEQQDRLSAEARRVEAELDLRSLLRPIGEPVLVGSAALGVMVRRDLDLTVVCPNLDPTGMWNTDPIYPDGLYLGVSYRALDGHDWTLDIWFVDRPDRKPALEHLRTLAPRLDARHRTLVLGIKRELATTVAEFDAWRADQA
jgi:hypothetical protein